MRVITARSNNILFNPAQFCLVPQWEQQTGGEGEAVRRKEIATPADGPVLAAEVRGRSLSARETPQTPEKLPWATATLPLPLPSSLWLGWNLRPFLTTAGRGGEWGQGSPYSGLPPLWSPPLHHPPPHSLKTSFHHCGQIRLVRLSLRPPPLRVSFLPSPLLCYHPPCALNPVLIGKSVEPCHP